MIQERDYLAAKLKEAGVKSAIYTSMKKLRMTSETHLGAVLHNGDTFERRNSRKRYEDGTGKKMVRVTRIFRTSSFNVVISDAEAARCEEIFKKFLLCIGDGVYVDGNWVDLEIGKAEWIEKDDSVLKANIAVQVEILFKHQRLYEDIPVKQVNLRDIT